MPSVAVLSWKQLYDKLHTAQVLCDSSLGVGWNITLKGTSTNNTNVNPQTVIVDNMGNDASVKYVQGISTYDIPAFTRRTVFMQRGQQFALFNVTKGVVTLTFCDFNPDLADERNDVATNVSANQQSVAQTGTATTPPSNPVPQSFATFNPSDKSPQIILSGANLRASGNAGQLSWSSVRATVGKNAGLWYFEQSADYTFFLGGIALVTQPLGGQGATNYVGDATNTSLGFYNDRTWVKGGVHQGVIDDMSNPGTVGCYAVNCTAKRLFFRRAGGNWAGVNGLGADPTVAAQGIDISFLLNVGLIYPIVSLYQSGSSMAFNGGQSTFAGAVPAGYTAGWG